MCGRELNEGPKFSLFTELNSTRDYTSKSSKVVIMYRLLGKVAVSHISRYSHLLMSESNQQRTNISDILRTPTSKFKKVYTDLLHGCCFVTVNPLWSKSLWMK